MKILWLVTLLAMSVVLWSADVKQPAIDEKLGQVVEIDKISFLDENGVSHTLKEFGEGKPIVLALAFFKCRSICMPFVNGVGELVDEGKGSLKPGSDYKLLTISFDETEGPDLAKDKKYNQFAAMKNLRSEETWSFLTGDLANIKALTEAVGFVFVKQEDGGILHKSSLIVLSPEGKVVRYLPGSVRAGKDTYFNAMSVDIAVSEAYKGISGPTLSKVLNVCFKFDPVNKKYSFKIMQAFGILVTLCGLLLFVSVTLLAKKKPVVIESKEKEGSEK